MVSSNKPKFSQEQIHRVKEMVSLAYHDWLARTLYMKSTGGPDLWDSEDRDVIAYFKEAATKILEGNCEETVK